MYNADMRADLHTNMPYNNFSPSRVVYRFSGHTPRWWYITSFTRGTRNMPCFSVVCASCYCQRHHLQHPPHNILHSYGPLLLRKSSSAGFTSAANGLRMLRVPCAWRPMELPHTWLWQLHQDEPHAQARWHLLILQAQSPRTIPATLFPQTPGHSTAAAARRMQLNRSCSCRHTCYFQQATMTPLLLPNPSKDSNLQLQARPCYSHRNHSSTPAQPQHISSTFVTCYVTCYKFRQTCRPASR
jgi:hypothetical protein